MNDIQYYVVLDKTAEINKTDQAKINEIEVEIQDTRLPFSDKYVDLYLISNNKKECQEYIKNLDENIQKYFSIKQVGSEIQYTAFTDILGFSNYIASITNDDQSEELYGNFNEIVEYDSSANDIEIKPAVLPSERYGLSCAENSATHKIYCFGVYDGSDYLSQIVEYNPATDTLKIKRE